MNDSKKTKMSLERVMSVLHAAAPRAVHQGELAGRLGAGQGGQQELHRLLEQCCTRGLAERAGKRRYRAIGATTKQGTQPRHKPKSRQHRRDGRRPRDHKSPPPAPPFAIAPERAVDIIAGRLTMHPRGYGFVAAEDEGPDVFIPPGFAAEALHGDRVEVHTRPSARGREGRISAVLERGLRRLSGTLRRRGKHAWIEPDDLRLPAPVAVEGTVSKQTKDGAVVLAEIRSYPDRRGEGLSVEVVEVLGEHGATEVEVAKIKIREGVQEAFPDDVREEAKAIPTRLPQAERRRREDLRSLDLCTIDPADARDHDDALYAERLGDGGFRILIAIADVAYYVREGSALDREALARGCSIYLPDRAIPMLPPELSSRMASLIADRDRFCLAVEVELGPSGGIRKHRYLEGVMRSRAKLTYEGVARALGLTKAVSPDPAAEQRAPMLRALFDAAKILRSRRLRRGSLEFELPEPRVILDERGLPVDVIRSKRDPGVKRAYQLVEEMMLLANEVVAADLEKRDIPAIYRVHGPPNEEKIEQFAALAASVGYDLKPEEVAQPRTLSRFLRRIAGTPHQYALNYLLLRAMQQAVYHTHNIGHFGLASKHYLHFTSPIRRYPDIAVHRMVRAWIRKEEVDHVAARRALRLQAVEASRLERRAMVVERDVLDLYRTILMRDRVGEEFMSTVSGIADHGFYSAFDEPFVEALTPVERLDDDWFDVDPLGLRLVGRESGVSYALGDRLTLKLEDVRIAERQLIAVPVSRKDGGDSDGGSGHDSRGSRERPSKARRKDPGARSRQRSGRDARRSTGKRRKRRS